MVTQLSSVSVTQPQPPAEREMLLPTHRELGILAQLEGTARDRALGCRSRAAG